MEKIKIDTPYIKLDSFLKKVDIASSGGESKMLILDGNVQVNNEIEIRRGRKLYNNDIIKIGKEIFIIESCL